MFGIVAFVLLTLRWVVYGLIPEGLTGCRAYRDNHSSIETDPLAGTFPAEVYVYPEAPCAHTVYTQALKYPLTNPLYKGLSINYVGTWSLSVGVFLKSAFAGSFVQKDSKVSEAEMVCWILE